MTEQEKRQLKLAQQTEQLMAMHAEIEDTIEVIQSNGWSLSSEISNAIGSYAEIGKLFSNQVTVQGNHGSTLNLIRVLP